MNILPDKNCNSNTCLKIFFAQVQKTSSGTSLKRFSYFLKNIDTFGSKKFDVLEVETGAFVKSRGRFQANHCPPISGG